MVGDGVFRTLRVENEKILYLEEHLEKLRKECESLHIHFEYPRINVEGHKGISRLKIAVQAEERLLLTKWVKGHVTLSIQPYAPVTHCHKIGIYPEPFHRLNYKVKALSFLDQLTLITWAHSNGFDEVLTTNHEGYILEGAFCNVFWEEGETRYFVDRMLPYYEGLTQERIIKESRKIQFAKIKANELFTKKVFLCNSLKGIVPALFIIS